MGFFRNSMFFFRARHQKMADFLEKNPHLTPALRDTMENVLVMCEELGIDPKTLQFRVNMISDRRIMIRLLTPSEVAHERALAKRRAS